MTLAQKSGVYFYPRPPRGGRRHLGVRRQLLVCISIHALREEGDAGGLLPARHPVIFLSTPSARRATLPDCGFVHEVDISIHALREEGDSERPLCIIILIYFYPRPPRGGRRVYDRG